MKLDAFDDKYPNKNIYVLDVFNVEYLILSYGAHTSSKNIEDPT